MGLLIYGKNGIGKTNLLEAIAYFSFGKSFRLLSDSEVISFSEKQFFIEGNFKIQNIDRNIKIKASKDKKVIKIDDNIIKKSTELYKFVKTVYFSPNDINIVEGYPLNRRRFFDIAISQYDFKYLELLKQYNRILKQRNALLKREYSEREKEIWDKQFVYISKDIILQRIKYLKKFNAEMKKFYGKVTENKEEISISHSPEYPESDQEILQMLFEKIKSKENEEKILQRSLLGPHLHDFKFLLNGLPIKKFGSQGQKRSFVISLRLSQAKLIDISTNDPPILIFDDVLSELDSERSKNIFHLLGEKHQIFIATPNRKTYRPLQIESINLEEMLKDYEN